MHQCNKLGEKDIRKKLVKKSAEIFSWLLSRAMLGVRNGRLPARLFSQYFLTAYRLQATVAALDLQGFQNLQIRLSDIAVDNNCTANISPSAGSFRTLPSPLIVRGFNGQSFLSKHFKSPVNLTCF